MSRRDGYTELYLMNSDGRSLRQLTHQPRGELTGLIERDGMAAAVAYFRRMRTELPGATLFGDRAGVVLTTQFIATGRSDDAIRVARMGVETHPGSWNAHTALAQALLTAGEREAAAAEFRASLSINPNQYQVVFQLGLVEFIEILESIDGIFVEKGVDVFDLVHRLQTRGEILTALALLKRLDLAHPNDADVLGRLGYMHMILGDHRSAAGTFRRVLALDPNDDDAAFHLARIRGLADAPRSP